MIKELIDNNSDRAWDREPYCCVVLRCGRVVIVSPFWATRLVEWKVRKSYFPRTWVFRGLFSVLHSQWKGCEKGRIRKGNKHVDKWIICTKNTLLDCEGLQTEEQCSVFLSLEDAWPRSWEWKAKARWTEWNFVFNTAGGQSAPRDIIYLMYLTCLQYDDWSN